MIVKNGFFFIEQRVEVGVLDISFSIFIKLGRIIKLGIKFCIIMFIMKLVLYLRFFDNGFLGDCIIFVSGEFRIVVSLYNLNLVFLLGCVLFLYVEFVESFLNLFLIYKF